MPPRRMIPTRQPRQQLLPLLLIIILALSLHLHISSAQAHDTSSSSSYANHIPIRYKVNQKQTECLYERFQKGEQVSFSVFVVEALLNGKPKCDLFYEGPITTQTINNDSNNNGERNNNNNMSLGRMIRQGLLNELVENRRDATKSLNHRIKVDWTHAGEEEDKLLMRQEIERANTKQLQRHHSDPNHKPISTFASPRIEPFEITNTIPASGYYRVCAQAELQALVIEMDARSSSKMGGVDEETGHVYTYAKRDLLNEEAAIDNKNGNNKNGSRLDSNTYQSDIEELSKLLVNQVEDADLRQTREQIKVLNAKTSDIMTEIQTRMTRIRAHEHGARRNSANMAWSSKVKTLVFAVISGFQVYTMRKWLLSNSLLGR
eukprot:scaffold6849_cov157-Skeletonema_marinoi.AAC.5